MTDFEEKLAKSLSARTTELLPHLPYLLQDLWEMGSSPADVLSLLTAHLKIDETTSILDLGCGKGAVSVRLARAFGCRARGVDILPEFIAAAQEKAREHGVSERCEFLIGDVNRSVETEKDYDVVILGALGDVLGTHLETLVKLKRTVKPGGLIILDDAIGAGGALDEAPGRQTWDEIFRRSGVSVLDLKPVDFDEMVRTNRFNQAAIEKRAGELAVRYPELAALFAAYVADQQAECDALENEIVGVTWLLKAAAQD